MNAATAGDRGSPAWRRATTWRRPATWHLAFATLLLLAANCSVAVSQLALGLTLLAMLWRRVRGDAAWWPNGLEWTAGLLAAWALAMVPLSTAPHQSLVFYKRFYLFTALWVLAPLARDEAGRRWLAGSLLAGAAGISIVGVAQVVQATGGLMRSRLAQVNNPMTSGALLMLALLAAIGFLLARGHSRRARWWLLGAAAPVALALVHTMTRSALLGAGAGVAVMVLAARPRLFLWFAGAGVLSFVLLLTVGERVLPDTMWRQLSPAFAVHGVDTSERFDLWRGGLRMVAERPITGFGDRDLLALMPKYVDNPRAWQYGHLHNNVVHLAVIWGVPGCALALAFLTAPAIVVRRHWRRRDAAGPPVPWRDGWLLAALGVWAGYGVAGLTEWYFGDAEPSLLYLVVLGIALGGAATKPLTWRFRARSVDE
jgi:O-antigen ligase